MFGAPITCLSATFFCASQISLPTQSAAPGANVVGPAVFASQASSVSGVQFDLQYDNSALKLVVTLGDSPKTSGKSLYSVDIAPNKKRFLIVGLNQTLIPDGTLLELYVSVSATAASGVYGLTLSNISGTDPSGQAVAMASSDGTLNVNASSAASLQSNGVLNAGSFLAGPVAPGELVTLKGSGIGPPSAQYPTGAPSNSVLAGTSVLFDGTAAPLLYASPNQINAIVPYGVSGNASTQLSVTANGQTIAAVSEAVSPASPAIFTLDSTGTGGGAILNQDSSVNSLSNPAAKGSIVSLFATGAGLTNPPSLDGEITGSVLASPVLPTSVQIGGLDAKILYAGAAPGLVTGVIQVNALIPDGAASGAAVPVVLGIGSARSQSGVTLSIK